MPGIFEDILNGFRNVDAEIEAARAKAQKNNQATGTGEFLARNLGEGAVNTLAAVSGLVGASGTRKALQKVSQESQEARGASADEGARGLLGAAVQATPMTLASFLPAALLKIPAARIAGGKAFQAALARGVPVAEAGRLASVAAANAGNMAARVGMAGSMGAMAMPDELDNARAHNLGTLETIADVAGAGLTEGGISFLMPGGASKVMLNDTAQVVKRGFLPSLIVSGKNIGKESLSEGVEEGATELAHIVRENALEMNPRPLSGENLERIGKAVGSGGIMGAGFHVPGETKTVGANVLEMLENLAKKPEVVPPPVQVPQPDLAGLDSRLAELAAADAQAAQEQQNAGEKQAKDIVKRFQKSVKDWEKKYGPKAEAPVLGTQGAVGGDDAQAGAGAPAAQEPAAAVDSGSGGGGGVGAGRDPAISGRRELVSFIEGELAKGAKPWQVVPSVRERFGLKATEAMEAISDVVAAEPQKVPDSAGHNLLPGTDKESLTVGATPEESSVVVQDPLKTEAPKPIEQPKTEQALGGPRDEKLPGIESMAGRRVRYKGGSFKGQEGIISEVKPDGKWVLRMADGKLRGEKNGMFPQLFEVLDQSGKPQVLMQGAGNERGSNEALPVGFNTGRESAAAETTESNVPTGNEGTARIGAGNSTGSAEIPSNAGSGSGAKGSATSVVVAGRPAVAARYEVRELATIQASHLAVPSGQITVNPSYPVGLQPRDYRQGGDEHQKVLNQAQGLNPALMLSDAPEATSGPSIITNNGTVINGNSRVMTLQAASPQKSLEYKKALMAKARQFGVEPTAVDAMNRPVLVRVVDMDPASPEAKEFARTGNVSLTQAQSPTRTAASLADLIDEHALSSIHIDDDSTFSEAVTGPDGARFRQKLQSSLPSTLQSLYFDENGGLTDQGKALVRDMLLMKILPVEVAEGMRETRRQLIRTLEASIPQMLRLKDEAGAREVNAALLEGLKWLESRQGVRSEADVEALVDASGKQIQGDLFGRNDDANLTPAGRMLVSYILREQGSPRRFKTGIVDAMKAIDQKRNGIFGESMPPEGEIVAKALGVPLAQGAWNAETTRKSDTTETKTPVTPGDVGVPAKTAEGSRTSTNGPERQANVGTGLYGSGLGEKSFVDGELAKKDRVRSVLEKMAQKMVDEAKGEGIIEQMIADGESPAALSKEFFSNTYDLLPEIVRGRFDRYLLKLWGEKAFPITVDSAGTIASNAKELAVHSDFPDNAEHLEGTERGFFALMKVAVEKVSKERTRVGVEKKDSEQLAKAKEKLARVIAKKQTKVNEPQELLWDDPALQSGDAVSKTARAIRETGQGKNGAGARIVQSEARHAHGEKGPKNDQRVKAFFERSETVALASGDSLLGVANDYYEDRMKSFDVVGQKVKTPFDAAALFAMLRSPYAERFSWMVTDLKGKVVGSGVHSVGSISATDVPEGLLDARYILAAAKKAGSGARVWVAHNHPSGNPEPSGADKIVYRKLREKFKGRGLEFSGVITNGKRFAHYLEFGEFEIKEYNQPKDWELFDRDTFRIPMNGPELIAESAKRVVWDTKAVLTLTIDVGMGLSGLGVSDGNTGFTDELRLASGTGENVVLVSQDSEVHERLLQDYRSYGPALLDVILLHKNGWTVSARREGRMQTFRENPMSFKEGDSIVEAVADLRAAGVKSLEDGLKILDEMGGTEYRNEFIEAWEASEGVGNDVPAQDPVLPADAGGQGDKGDSAASAVEVGTLHSPMRKLGKPDDSQEKMNGNAADIRRVQGLLAQENVGGVELVFSGDDSVSFDALTGRVEVDPRFVGKNGAVAILKNAKGSAVDLQDKTVQVVSESGEKTTADAGVVVRYLGEQRRKARLLVGCLG